MNYEKYLIKILKEQYEEMVQYTRNLDDKEIEKLYRDSNGEIYPTDGDFIKAHKKELLSVEMMDAIHSFLIQVSLLEKDDMERLVAYLSEQFYIGHYHIEKEKPALKFLAQADIKDIVNLFYDNDFFGRDALLAFYQNAITPEQFKTNLDKIQEDGHTDVLEKFYKITTQEKVFTLNQKLREYVCNLYYFYIDRGYSDAEALDLTWAYFRQGLDPLNQLDELGCNEEEKAAYRKYTLSLIIADMYEDFANGPLVKTDNPNGRTAQMYPVLLAALGRIRIPKVPEVRERMLKYFILLQDNPDKVKANRERTHKEQREKTLKKVNPCYILDELTF